MTAMRGRIALQMHFDANQPHGCSVLRKLRECARVLTRFGSYKLIARR